MERAEHVFVQSLLQPDLIGDVVAEQLEDVDAIGAFRCGGHAQHEVGIPEMVDDALIPFGARMMNFVDKNVVELVRGELRQGLRLTHGLHRGEHVAPILLFAGAGIQSQLGLRTTEHLLVGFHRRFEDHLLLGDVQHAPGPVLTHVERGKIGFACSRGRHDDRTMLPFLA